MCQIKKKFGLLIYYNYRQQRSCGKVMFFIPVCDSVHGGVSVRETPVRLRAGGTHPTGMLSCFCISSVEAPLIVDGSFSPTPGSDLRPDVSIMFSLQFDKPVRTFKMETHSGSGFYVCVTVLGHSPLSRPVVWRWSSSPIGLGY